MTTTSVCLCLCRWSSVRTTRKLWNRSTRIWSTGLDSSDTNVNRDSPRSPSTWSACANWSWRDSESCSHKVLLLFFVVSHFKLNVFSLVESNETFEPVKFVCVKLLCVFRRKLVPLSRKVEQREKRKEVSHHQKPEQRSSSHESVQVCLPVVLTPCCCVCRRKLWSLLSWITPSRRSCWRDSNRERYDASQPHKHCCCQQLVSVVHRLQGWNWR